MYPKKINIEDYITNGGHLKTGGMFVQKTSLGLVLLISSNLKATWKELILILSLRVV